MASKHKPSHSRRGKPVAEATDAALGARVRQRRLDLCMTQQALAGALGVSFQQVQKYEKGTNRIAAVTLIRIAHALDVPPASLLDGLSP